MTTTKTNEPLRAQLRTLARKVDRLLQKDEEREADAVAELAARVARDAVRTLRKDVARLNAAVAALQTAPGDPTVVPRLVRRDIFDEGRRLYKARVDAVVRLHDARREYEQVDEAFERLKAKLARGGGPFADGSFARDDEDRLQEELAKLNSERTQLWSTVEEAQADVEEAERRLRPFTVVHTRAMHLGDVEIQE